MRLGLEPGWLQHAHTVCPRGVLKMAVSRDRVITEDSVTSEELREEQEHFQKVVNAFLHYR